MKISIRSKKSNTKSGEISSPDISRNCTLRIGYKGNPKFLVELQKLLLKYYDLKIISGRGRVGSKVILNKLKKGYKSKTRGESFHNIISKKNEKH